MNLALLLLVTIPTPNLAALEDVREVDPPLSCLAPFVRADYARWAYHAAWDLERECDEIAAALPEECRGCYQKRSWQVYICRLAWNCLVDAQDESRTDADRRRSLSELRQRIGYADFYRGVMPPPLPAWAVPPPP